MVKPDKSRYVYLYIPSAEEKAKWEKLANDAGVPLTKFVIEIVQDALSEDVEVRPRGELTKEITALRKEIKGLRDELKLKTILRQTSMYVRLGDLHYLSGPLDLRDFSETSSLKGL